MTDTYKLPAPAANLTIVCEGSGLAVVINGVRYVHEGEAAQTARQHLNSTLWNKAVIRRLRASLERCLAEAELTLSDLAGIKPQESRTYDGWADEARAILEATKETK